MINELIKNNKNIELPSGLSSKYGDVDGLSLQNLFYAREGVFPGCLMFSYDNRETSGYAFDVNRLLSYFTEKFDDVEMIPYITNCIGKTKKKDKNRMTFCLVIPSKKIYARFQEDATESYILFTNDNYELAKEIARDVEEFYVAPEKEFNIYWRLCCSNGGYYLDKGNIKAPEYFDVEKLYNDDFIEEDKKIREFIGKEDKSGLVILHGEKGTGKSTYIKNLVNQFPQKRFVYVPASLINLMGDPSFGSFLTTLNNHVIVLEDCENSIRDRKNGGSASAVSLLLNLTDGILSDDLGMKFICTFNEDMKNIDSALLRKGRLVSKYEFKPLCKEKAKAILEERGMEDVSLSKALTLADIFNFSDKSYEKEEKTIL